MNARLVLAGAALALVAGCGVRTPLRSSDGFVDDDPWLKTDAASDTRPRDGGVGAGGGGGSGGAVPAGPDAAAVSPDAPRMGCEGAGRALRDVARRLWEGEPESRHLALAESGQLCAPAAFEGVVREMLRDPRAERGLGSFFRWWLNLAALRTLTKDPGQWAGFEKVGSFLADEVERFGVRTTMMDGRFAALMTEPRAYQDMLVVSVAGDDGSDRTRRGGLLVRPGLLALHARPDRPSPTARGAFVRRDLLCMDVPPHPPNSISAVVPPQPMQLTNRQHYQALTSAPTCGTCHALMDPIGFALENYDAVGRFRTSDHGQRIDAGGKLNGLSTGEVQFAGAAELGKILAGAQEARRCIVTKWVHYFSGPDASMRLVDRAHAAFESAGGDMREAIVVVLAAALP